MEQEVPFKIFSNCVATKGSNRSTICDLQRNKIHLIPNSLYDILSDFQGFTIANVKANYEGQYDEIIDEYFTFLTKEELVYFTAFPEWFPAMDLQWHSPFMINNCIIDIDEKSDFSFNEIFESLNKVNCKFLEIRCYSSMSISFYKSLLAHIKGSTIISIGLIIKDNEDTPLQEWDKLCDDSKRITSLTLHSSSESRIHNSFKLGTPIKFIQTILPDETCCGIINEGYFRAYTETFTEARVRNSCLNGKVSIDRRGNIKNCPSLKESFGNVYETTIVDAIKHQQFTKNWYITKDQIEICKDCEFRYVCTDCRAYIENPENIYSKPIKCGYDPYTCKWEDWSLNPLKQETINFYGFQN